MELWKSCRTLALRGIAALALGATCALSYNYLTESDCCQKGAACCKEGAACCKHDKLTDAPAPAR
jgi:hypothetical protein